MTILMIIMMIMTIISTNCFSIPVNTLSIKSKKNHLTYIYLTVSDENSDTDSDIDDTDDATVMGSSVAYAEVEASIRALRYGSVEGNQGEHFVL